MNQTKPPLTNGSSSIRVVDDQILASIKAEINVIEAETSTALPFISEPVIVEVNPIDIDRPGWIPAHITQDWEPDPYAYQTEDESMPAGGLQGRMLAKIMQVLDHELQTQGLMLLMDVFVLYRDQHNIKQRFSPDLLLMPYRDPAPAAYDLDHEPPPSCVIEVTSPESHEKDLVDNVPFYIGLGIQTYLVIDAINPRGQKRAQIELHLWRSVNGQAQKMSPDPEGNLDLPEMGFKVKAIGQWLIFSDALTGEVLLDTTQFVAALEEKQQALAAERLAREQAEKTLLAEQQAHQDKLQNIALVMWQQGLAVEVIAQATGLLEADLKALFATSGLDEES